MKKEEIIKYLKRMGCEKGGVVINEEELRKMLEARDKELIEKVKRGLETFVWDKELGEDIISNIMENRRKLNQEIINLIK